ncbi:2-phosphosulfolactate phosphatase [Leifsonia sp. H3M29-4]|uniref:2-phosphosulfolactate phosphatase n=1 Tax=Salinibacterium metalliresistens TaxID=3031321 RepID=UPI0023DB7AA9|nr:2-phosphosulfolactate phosphatase [Salinibacterium metalliresistens]MDF1478453.1 2-phosphosulfolactate phosphatase [Salinibacterium metalliresistens]
MSDPRNQTKYQVRFDWGLAGAAAIAPGSHIVVWADALPEPVADPLALRHDGALITGSVGSRTAVAQWILAKQVELGGRAVVAVVAAGGPDGRFAVEDLLAAGAVIDALAEVGIDFTSPEAAAAAGAFAGLRNATAHVLSACVSGQEAGAGAVAAAREANARAEFGILREFGPSA